MLSEESDDERAKEVKVTIVDSSPDQIYMSPEQEEDPDDEVDEVPESPAFMLDDKNKVEKAVPGNKEELSF